MWHLLHPLMNIFAKFGFAARLVNQQCERENFAFDLAFDLDLACDPFLISYRAPVESFR